jgi:hypothetical protein
MFLERFDSPSSVADPQGHPAPCGRPATRPETIGTHQPSVPCIHMSIFRGLRKVFHHKNFPLARPSPPIGIPRAVS